MSLRFRKSVKLGNNAKLNISKTGVSVSVGRPGARLTMHSNGRKTATVGIPGSGLSYSKSIGGSAYSNRKNIQSRMKDISKLEEIERNKLEVEEYENSIEVLHTIHLSDIEEIDWKELSTRIEPSKDYEEQVRKEMENYKPGFLESKRKKEKKEQEFEVQLEEAREKDVEVYNEWKSSKDFSKEVREGNIDTYLRVLEESTMFEDLVDYGCDFEFGTENKEVLEIEFIPKVEEVVPTSSKTLTKTGKLSTKELTKTMYYDYTQDYICSCMIRIGREVFALLPVKEIILHTQQEIVNTSTGHSDKIDIVSIVFTRDRFENTNFERIDPSDFIQSFRHEMKFSKTTGFKEISRIQ